MLEDYYIGELDNSVEKPPVRGTGPIGSCPSNAVWPLLSPSERVRDMHRRFPRTMYLQWSLCQPLLTKSAALPPAFNLTSCQRAEGDREGNASGPQYETEAGGAPRRERGTLR